MIGKKVFERYISGVLSLALVFFGMSGIVCPVEAAKKNVKKPALIKSLNMYVGQSFNCKVKKCTWKSSNPKVAKVSKKGIIKARKTGNAKITAVHKKTKKKATCKVKVGNYIKSLKVNSAETVMLKPGQTSSINVSMTPGNVLYKGLTYNVANPAIAKVSKKGIITPVSDGVTTVTVTSKAVTKKKKALNTKITVVVSGYQGAVNNTTEVPTEQPKNDLITGDWEYDIIIIPTKTPDLTATITPAPTDNPLNPPVDNPTNNPGNSNPGVPTTTPDGSATDSPTNTPTVSSTMTPTATPTTEPVATAIPTAVPTVTPTSVAEYVNSLEAKPDDPLVGSVVVGNKSNGQLRTMYFLNKEYKGSMKVEVDGYFTSNSGNVVEVLDTLETEKNIFVTNNSNTVKVGRRYKTDSWSIQILPTGAVYYISARVNDVLYNSKFGIIIAEGNTLDHIKIAK